MSATADVPRDPSPIASSGPGRASPDLAAGLGVCPFLRSRDGAWSSAVASRDLRCWAVQPAAQLAAAKQRDLCVLAAHTTCSTFAAATAADPLDRPDPASSGLWPTATPVPVALEPLHARPGVSVASPRSGGQALLIGLMVLAFIVLVLARTSGPLGGGSASPSPAASAVALASPTASEATGASPSMMPSAAPSAVPSQGAASPSAPAAASPSPAPSAAQRTYKVRSGDTLGAIAAKFGTTVKAIATANHIADGRTIHPGQVLVIP